MIRGCAIILGTFSGSSRIFGYFLGYSRILGYHFFAILGFLGIIFLVKFHFPKKNPDFWVLILIFY